MYLGSFIIILIHLPHIIYVIVIHCIYQIHLFRIQSKVKNIEIIFQSLLVSGCEDNVNALLTNLPANLMNHRMIMSHSDSFAHKMCTVCNNSSYMKNTNDDSFAHKMCTVCNMDIYQIVW